MTLAGYIAAPSTWQAFDRAWNAVLGDEGSPYSYLHMCEIGMRSDETVYRLINECIIRFAAATASDGGLYGGYCSILRSDFEAARSRATLLARRSLESVCVEWVAAFLVRFGIEGMRDRDGFVATVVFDQGEPFARELRHQKALALRSTRAGGELFRIEDILEKDSRRTPGLQAADYLAWHVNRWKATDRGVMANLRAVLPTPGRGDFATVDKLLEWYDTGVPDFFGLGFGRS